MKYELITILGPTAVGKTRLAALLAHKFNGEIISADSRQVYKRMNIGTGKDLEDYVVNGGTIKYHLIDIFEPTEEFNVYLFQKLFYNSFNKIQSNGKLPFLVGGTGMYLSSILSSYNLPEVNFESQKQKELEKQPANVLRTYLKEINTNLHNTTDLEVKERIIKAILTTEKTQELKESPRQRIQSFIIGIKEEREKIKKNITERLELRLANGMIDEVKSLLEIGLSYEKLKFFGLEYKYVSMYLMNEINYNDMFQRLNSAIHKFAKRQMTWFRKMEKDGIEIHWLEGPDFNKAQELIQRFVYDGT
ncbi:tRNA dimethylallyltransferase [bacterium BMS3Abin04]|nr:tRNA dimethylallyltransferase [bacterium BMS3Abin04]